MSETLAEVEKRLCADLDPHNLALRLGEKLKELAEEHRYIGRTKGREEVHELYATQLELTFDVLRRLDAEVVRLRDVIRGYDRGYATHHELMKAAEGYDGDVS